MENTKIPWVIYAESTPNPMTMKFVTNQLLVENGNAVEYVSKDQAKESPLALELFSFPFVTGVFITSNFVTVTRNDTVGWELIANELREFIKGHLENHGSAFTDSFVGEQTTSTVEALENVGHAEPTSEIDKEIIKVLDEYVKPAVEQDGGLINFKSFDEGIVTVQLRGSCSGCPSSTVTLKGGIEQLLKRTLPEDIKEVVAEEL